MDESLVMKFPLPDWLRMPASNATKDVPAPELWHVRWWSAGSNYEKPPFYPSATPEVEVFISEAEALTFAESLRNAFTLLRYSGHVMVRVVVEKAVQRR